MRTPLPENREKVIAAIKVKPMTIPALSAALSISQPTINRILEELRAEKMCFVLDYEIREKSNARAAVYAFGEGIDADRPARVPKAESNRRYKEKLINYACTAAEMKRYDKIRKELERPAFRHQFDVWLFGPVKAPSKPAALPVRVFQQDMTITKDELEDVV